MSELSQGSGVRADAEKEKQDRNQIQTREQLEKQREAQRGLDRAERLLDEHGNVVLELAKSEGQQKGAEASLKESQIAAALLRSSLPLNGITQNPGISQSIQEKLSRLEARESDIMQALDRIEDTVDDKQSRGDRRSDSSLIRNKISSAVVATAGVGKEGMKILQEALDASFVYEQLLEGVVAAPGGRIIKKAPPRRGQAQEERPEEQLEKLSEAAKEALELMRNNLAERQNDIAA